MCDLGFLCAGESGADPGCAEFYGSGFTPADRSGRLSQPPHGESLSVGALEPSSPFLFDSALVFVGLRSGFNRPVL